MKGKQKKLRTKLMFLVQRFGGDPELKNYLGSSPKFRPYDGIWYPATDISSDLHNPATVYLLLPYQNGSWTEDKLCFTTMAQMEDFCNYINCKLVRET